MRRLLLSPCVVACWVAAFSLCAGWYAGSGSGSADAAPRGPSASASDRDLDVTARAGAENGIWIHPGPRNLDPKVFGTVADPFGTQFMIGVPLYDRLHDGQGNWTKTGVATPASNVTTPLGPGSYAHVLVRDRTPVDLPSFTSVTHDEVELEVAARDPAGRLIEIRATTPLPKGPFHEFFGGVGTNLIQHGRTGLGGKLVPQVFAYVSIYAKGEIRIDGQLLPGNDDQLVHCMVTQGVRDAGNAPGPAGGNGPYLGTDAEVDRDDLELHVMMPGIRFLPGPMPNQPIFGVGQSFVHMLFEDVTLTGTSINGILRR